MVMVVIAVLLVATTSWSVEGQTPECQTMGCVVDKAEMFLCLLVGDGAHPWNYIRSCCQVLRSKVNCYLQCALGKELRPTIEGLHVRRCFRAGITCPTDGP
jgi:hypothetical protein